MGWAEFLSALGTGMKQGGVAGANAAQYQDQQRQRSLANMMAMIAQQQQADQFRRTGVWHDQEVDRYNRDVNWNRFKYMHEGAAKKMEKDADLKREERHRQEDADLAVKLQQMRSSGKNQFTGVNSILDFIKQANQMVSGRQRQEERRELENLQGYIGQDDVPDYEFRGYDLKDPSSLNQLNLWAKTIPKDSPAYPTAQNALFWNTPQGVDSARTLTGIPDLTPVMDQLLGVQLQPQPIQPQWNLPTTNTGATWNMPQGMFQQSGGTASQGSADMVNSVVQQARSLKPGQVIDVNALQQAYPQENWGVIIKTVDDSLGHGNWR